MNRHAEAKEALVQYGQKMAANRLTTGSGGNLSVINRRTRQVAITPSGLDYFEMTPDDIVMCDLQGNVKQGKRKPSSEINFHLALYHHRADIGAVVHTHSVYAGTLACLHLEIPAVHYLVGFSGTNVPLAPYATFGTPELARSLTSTIGDCNAVLLANHGLVSVGPNIATAFTVAEEIEFVAQIYYQTLIAGDPKILTEAQMSEVLKKFKTYGQSKP
jgi:L-fuculose-phosphate aldolase